jgi:MoaA/NifB/PqqE/SkfB family radical SAM enzyme
MRLLPDWLRRLLGDSHPSPVGRSPVLQIEITSRCHMQCIFCPRQALKDRWATGDLAFELVYLQGWGEPTLHPHLWDMLDLAHKAGCRTGFTTNGTRLTPDYSTRLLDAGVDILCVSLAGASRETHEALRVGSRFEDLVTNIQALTRLKAQRGGDGPWLELHFLMTRANIHELPAFVKLAASLGADEAVATNLTYTPTPELEGLRAFDCHKAEPAYQEFVARARDNAQKSSIAFRLYPPVKGELFMECDARPLETAFVNSMGYVTPCVYLGLSVKGDIPRIFCGQQVSVSPVSFGHVSQGLKAAFHGQEAEEFKAPLRKLKMSTHPALMFAALATENASDHTLPDYASALPIGCRSCYKQYGM